MALHHVSVLSSKYIITHSKLLNFCCYGSRKWCSKDYRGNESVPKTDETKAESGTDIQKSSKKVAPLPPRFMKFKRRSLSPMERVGALIADTETDSAIEEKQTDEKNQVEDLPVVLVNSELDSERQNQNINILKQRRSVIPSKRLKTLIPDEYWKTEGEDSKYIVDNLDSNADTKDKGE